ncbi:MAG: response regulator [Alphaproteobacteria bacterium]|nr:response regulator [Alphaproteobacteria bacterium]
MKTNKSFINILLAEDNPADVRLTQEAFKDGKISNNLYVVKDGIEAMAFLRKEDKYEKMPYPDLFLLDLNMPRMDGREVLKEVKSDPKLKQIPIIILTTSEAESDVIKSYELHANCYITKPVDFEKFITVVKQIEEFWFSIVRLPPQEGI